MSDASQPGDSTNQEAPATGLSAGTPSIEEAWAAVVDYIEAAIEATRQGVLRKAHVANAHDAADRYALAVLDSQHTGGDYSPACGCMEWDDVADRCANYRILRARIEGLDS